MAEFFDLVASLQASIDDLDGIISGGENETVNINGVTKDTISKAIKDKFSVIQAMAQGRLSFETKAAMDSSGAPASSELSQVWNDPVSDNNGLYGWKTNTWIKSPYDIRESISLSLLDAQQKSAQSLSKSKVLTEATVADNTIVWALVDSNDKAAIFVDMKGVPHFPALEKHNDELYADDLVWGVMDSNDKLGIGLNKKGEAIFNRQDEFDIDSLKRTLLGDLVWGVTDKEERLAFGVTQAGRLVTAKDIQGIGELFLKNINGEVHVVDATEKQLTDKGDCFSPNWISSDTFKYLSDRFNGELISYIQHKSYTTPMPASDELHFFVSGGQSLSVGGSGASMPLVLGTPTYAEWCFKFNMGVRGRQWYDHQPSDFYSLTPLHEEVNGGDADTHGTAFGNAVFATLQNNIQSRKPLLFSCHGAGGASYLELKKAGVFDAGKQDAGQPTGIYERGLEQVLKAKVLAGRFNQALIVPAFLFTHGEDDAYKVGYIDDLRELIQDYQADIIEITGQSMPISFLIDQVGSRRNSTAAIDQYKFCVENHRAFMPLSKYFLNWNYSDGSLSHLSPQGYGLLGEYHAKAWNSIRDTGDWKPLSPKTISRTGLEVTLTLHVPVPPLKIDVTTLPAAKNHGFQYFDDSGEVPVTSVEVVGGEQLKITLAAPPSGVGEKLTCGYSSDLMHDNGSVYPLCNISDSDTTKSHIVEDYELVNWLIIFELEVN